MALMGRMAENPRPVAAAAEEAAILAALSRGMVELEEAAMTTQRAGAYEAVEEPEEWVAQVAQELGRMGRMAALWMDWIAAATAAEEEEPATPPQEELEETEEFREEPAAVEEPDGTRSQVDLVETEPEGSVGSLRTGKRNHGE